MKPAQTVTSNPVARSIDESAKSLGIGRTTMYRLISEKEIATFKIGARQLIADAELMRFVEHKTAMAQGDCRP